MILTYDDLAEIAADFVKEFNLPTYESYKILDKHFSEGEVFWKKLLLEKLKDGQGKDSTAGGETGGEK